jgi:hypothetical protein
MALLFLFGAGASYGSEKVSPYPPPLGKKLFKDLRARGGEAGLVDPVLADLFEENFELGIERFFRERNISVTQLLKEMAEYFAQFEPTDGNLYGKLLELLSGGRRKSIFATLNYDWIFEISACRLGLRVAYGLNLDPSRRVIPVLKIHGSCNFLPTAAPRAINFVVQTSPGYYQFSGGGVDIATNAAEVTKFCRSNTAFGPVMAMFAAGKQVLHCPEFIVETQREWRESVSAAAKIFVIGVRVNPVDDHIWMPLAQARAPVILRRGGA